MTTAETDSHPSTGEPMMFIYVFTTSGEWTYDDIRVVENRSEAWMYMKILGLRPRVLLKSELKNV